MKYSVVFSSFLFLAGGSFAAQPSAEMKQNTSGEQLDLLVAFSQLLIDAVIFNITQDPAPFMDFNYNLDSFYSIGDANITNALIIGLSNYKKRITLNVEREEVGLYITFPEVTLVGNYSLRSSTLYQYHLGLGEYSHVFTGVTFDAQYKLDNSTDRTETDPNAYHITRYTPQFFKFNITGCSLYAENYTIDGVLQTNWEPRSQYWMENHITKEGMDQYYDMIFGEASAFVLNISSRVFFKTVQKIIDELINDLGAVLVP